MGLTQYQQEKLAARASYPLRTVAAYVAALARGAVRAEQQALAWQTSAGLVAVGAAMLGIYALVLYARADLTLVQGDAIGHIYIARRTIDSITPGFAQFGYIWLPLPHVLMLPLVWNDTLWHTGLAGSIVSLIAFALATAYLYRTVCAITGSGLAGLVGAALFATNPNLLFMQATPMGETLTLLFIIGATYHTVRWAQDGAHIQLMLSAAFVFAGTLTRYEAWWLVPVGAAIVTLVAWRRFGFGRQVEGLILSWSVLAAYGIVLWLLYNLVIFGDALHFIHNIGSAQSFARERAASGVLPNRHDPLGSAALYGWAVIDIVGLPLVVAGVAGSVALVFSRVSLGVKCAVLLPASLFLFEIVSLSGEQSAMLSPHSSIPAFVNTRYGLLLLPATVIAASALVRPFRSAGIALLITALIPQLLILPTPSAVDASRGRILAAAAAPSYTQTWADNNFPFLQQGEPATLVEAVIASGNSKKAIDAEAGWLNRHATSGRILISEHFHASALMLYSELPLSRFIYEGNRPYFAEELRSPGLHSAWIVSQPRIFGDEVRPLLAGGHPPGFELAFDDGQLQIFRLAQAADPGETRPAAVPSTAKRVTGDFLLGAIGDNAQYDQVFYALRCHNNVASLATTRATIYAELPCAQVPDDRALLTQSVRLRVENRFASAIYADTQSAGTLRFTAGPSWVELRDEPDPGAPRPAGVTPAARLLDQGLDVGDAGDLSGYAHVLYAVRCHDGIVSVVTTKEVLYAELPCDRLPDDHQYLTKPVHLTKSGDATVSALRMEAHGLDPLVFTAGRSWLESR